MASNTSQFQAEPEEQPQQEAEEQQQPDEKNRNSQSWTECIASISAFRKDAGKLARNGKDPNEIKIRRLFSSAMGPNSVVFDFNDSDSD